MSTLRDAVWENNTVEGLPFPHDGLQERTRGTVEGDVVVICAGSGVGKTEFVTETLYHLHFARNEAVGVLFLEDPDIRTAERVVGRHLKKRLHIDRDGLTRAEFDKAWDEVFAHRDIPMLVEFGFSDPELFTYREKVGPLLPFASARPTKEESEVAIAEALASYTQQPDSCFFAVWEGNTAIAEK